ncbi:MAG: CRISPR-associated helicase Cas3' [Desulfobacterales bacterium]|nr:CRISPR-associated helicase Cas3' [Desulfobacterales bacterium]
MLFYSHCKENSNGEREPTKKLQKHLSGVSENIEFNIHPYLNFEDFPIHPILHKFLGLFHDIGKYTTYFQEYLLYKKYENEPIKNHAFSSAVFAFNFMQEFADIPKLLPFITYYCIRYHHGKLVPPAKLSDKSQQISNLNNLEKQAKNILERAKTDIESLIRGHFHDLDAFQLKEHFFEYQEKINKIARRIQRKSANINNYFITIYLFSLLISSDKIDAGEADRFKPESISPDLIDTYLSNKKDASLVDIRSRAKDDIEHKLSEIDIKTDKLFTITAPTGIGKTLSVMNFALKLKEKIYKSPQGYHPQIIYCLPFINIIEQTYKVFNELFDKEKVRLLKHHQYTDIWAMASNDNSGRERELSKTLLEVEDWQADVVLTTFVQFFHSVISNQNRMLKKFYRLAGSIIILDEVQSIKAEYWPLIGAVLYHLSEFLNCRIILMTATQPHIFKTANEEIFKQELIVPKPLLDHKETGYYFSQFKRTKIVPLINKENPLKSADDFYSLFSEKWNGSKSCLIVVNTIKRSLELFEKLKKENVSPYIYYLSTNIVPIHRKYVIWKVKNLLKKGKKVILVSTQSIEAGVDLDFDMGYRDIGPLDSIIQVAGRINRNDREGFEDSPLYIVNFKEDARRIYGKILINRSLEVLLNIEKEYLSEDEYLKFIQKYYDRITDEDSSSFKDSRQLYEAMEKLRFTREDYEEDELAIDDFKLIDDAAKINYADVFVPINKYAIKTLDIYLKEYLPCKDIYKKRQIFLKIKSAFNQYKLSAPLRIINKLFSNSSGIEERIKDRIYVVSKEYIGMYNDENQNILYDYNTGLCRKEIESETLIF